MVKKSTKAKNGGNAAEKPVASTASASAAYGEPAISDDISALLRLNEDSKIGTNVRVVRSSANKSKLLEGPEWEAFKAKLSLFYITDKPNKFLNIQEITIDDHRSQWERHKNFNARRVQQEGVLIPIELTEYLEKTLVQEVQHLRGVFKKQITPMLAFSSSFEEAVVAAQKLVGGQISIANILHTTLENSLTDILVIQGIQDMAEIWKVSKEHLDKLLDKHVFNPRVSSNE